ncbi:MAG: type IX secretion system sortase PorU [Paramuribaculum sp.]|nr:type IX secretion system sortase PorU [Paramuribaculum sp.]
MKATNVHTYILAFLTALAAMFVTPQASAFSVDTYTSESVLASGRWQKISIETSGIHFIPASTLRSWGFSSPRTVKIHGYGGELLPDALTAANYIDDLPLVQTVATDAGIYFYATGPMSVTYNTSQKAFTHSNNYFSDKGYYFITENDNPAAEIPYVGEAIMSSDAVSTYTCLLVHDIDEVSISGMGRELFGEDFRTVRNRTFNFDLTDKADNLVKTTTSFAAAHSSNGTLNFSANGKPISGSTTVSTPGSYADARGVTARKNFELESDHLAFTIDFTPGTNLTAAYLNYITVNYTRLIALPASGSLMFHCDQRNVKLSRAKGGTHVWDVTNPQSIKALNTKASGSDLYWESDYSGMRTYVAWNEGVSYPAPKLEGSVANQNLHGLSSCPDMIIITINEFASQAQRLADLHRNGPDKLNVEVISQDIIYPEFSSGVPDIGAFRRFLKMVYDRGNQAGKPLRYALLFGRGIFDNRHLTQPLRNSTTPYLPTWQATESLNVGASGSFTTDDYLAALSDGTSGQSYLLDLNIAVGRISASSLAQATTFVDKMYSYYDRTKNQSQWRNSMVIMADNANAGDFMKHAEENLYQNLIETDAGSQMVYNKIFVDAFPVIGGKSIAGRKRLMQLFDEGIMWLSYIGHGSMVSLSEESLLNPNDFEHMYNKQLPVFFGATCSFSRWDNYTPCGAEHMLFNPKGGIIGSISPVRESGIDFNGMLARTIGQYGFNRNPDGSLPTLGDIWLRAKKHHKGDSGRALFVLLGDPAMRLAMPDNIVTLDYINEDPVDPEAQVTIMGRQNVLFSGSVRNALGEPLDDFNGEILVTLYDAMFSTTTYGRADSKTSGLKYTFDEQNGKLHIGRGKVVNGQFSIPVSMPTEIAENFRPAAFSMYAYTADGRDAVGCNRDFYIYGIDETAEPDDNPPVIEYAYLNHESYTDGDAVNSSPVFIAKVHDDTAINLSTAGIGHQMILKLDDSRTFSDVSSFYTPSADDHRSGTIMYQLDEITPGNHTLSFRVWDTFGNSRTHTMSFFVDPAAAPKVFDVFTDANPAYDHANFYISHNRPDAELTVSIEIYDMMGRQVWTSSVTDRSDMFLSAPVTWNLCGTSGARVPRGIYIYRATVKEIDGPEIQSAAKRIAVAGH